MRTLGVYLGLVLALGVGGCDLFETSDGDVDDGNALLVEGKAAEAKAAYAEAAQDLPESAELNYVRGLAASAAGDLEGASALFVQARDQAIAKDALALTQKVYAAIGLNEARWALQEEAAPRPQPEDPEAAPTDAVPEAALSRWGKAVDALVEALVRDPSDEASRRSLEVALLRIDPPCSSRDDDFEDNDTVDAAPTITLAAEQPEAPAQSNAPAPAPDPGAQDTVSWKQQLYGCPEDLDWFEVELAAGDRVEMKLVRPEDSGRLTLDVVGPDKRTPVAPAADDAPREALAFVVAPEDAGKHYVRVTNLDLEEVGYSLEVKVRPACLNTEDRFEDNDTPETASTLTPGATPGMKICPDDDDWYRVTLAEGESLFAIVTLDDAGEDEGDDDEKADEPPEGTPPPPPPIHLELWGAEGRLGEGGPNGAGTRVATLLTPGEGTYGIRVWGEPELEARYTVMLQIVPPCPEGDDAFEDNDIAEAAVDLVEAAQAQAGQGQGGQPQQPQQQQQAPPMIFARVCPGDVDWWTFTQTETRPAIVSAVFDHAKGDLSLALYDAGGFTEIGVSDASSDAANGEALTLPPLEAPEDDAPTGDDPPPQPTPVRYAIRVAAASPEAENFYLLRVDQPPPSQSQDQSDSSDDSDESQEDESQNDEQQDPKDEADQDQRPPEDQQDREQQAEQQPSDTLQDMLDKLDRNPENLEARETARDSPLATHKPRKDW